MVLTIKISKITGIGTIAGKIISHLVTKFSEKQHIEKVASALGDTISKGSEGAAGALDSVGDAAEGAANGGFKSLLTAIGSTGAGIGLIAAVPPAIELIARFVETLQGGNGKLSDMGGAINDLAGELTGLGTISGDQADEIRKIVDSCEDAKMSAEEMTNKVMEKFSEWGVSTNNINAVLQNNEYYTTKTKDSIDLLTESAKQLGEGMSETKRQIDFSDVDTEAAYGGIRDALSELSVTGGEFSGTYQGILMSFDNTPQSGLTAQEMLDNVAASLESAGIPADEFIKLIGERFPEAVQTAETTTTTSVSNMESSVQASMSSASGTVSEKAGSIEEDIKSMAEEANSAVTSSFGDVETTSGTTWGNSEGSVVANINSMKSASSKGMKQIFKNVESYTKSIWNVMSNTWDSLAKKVSTALDGVSDVIISQMNSVIRTVNNAISNINYSISGIESAFNFGPWDVPTPTGSRIIGFSATFPRVPDIPYLATGAVIPPRSEFLAVLGDQKHGNNIEAPESLLRKIVREESGGRTGGTYQFVGQINRRVLFEEFMAEAQLVRSQSGRNPFEMA